MTAVPPRPAAGDPDFPYMLADTPEEFERVRGIGIPAAEDHMASGAPMVTLDDVLATPDATAGDVLREAIARGFAPRLWDTLLPRHRLRLYANADAVLALPALRDVLAAAARDAEKVRRVEALAMDLERCAPRELHPVRETAIHLRAALDPS